MSQLRTPSVSDPEKILHKRNWREKQTAHTDIPIFSLEYSPSSSQLAQVQGPKITARILEYSLGHPSIENIVVMEGKLRCSLIY